MMPSHQTLALAGSIILNIPVLQLNNNRSRPLHSATKEHDISPTRRCRQLVLKHEVTTATELKMQTPQRWMRDSIRKVRKRIAPRDPLSRCCAMSLALQVFN